MSQYEEKGGLIVPVEKKEPRRFASVRPFTFAWQGDVVIGYTAVSTDGAAFSMIGQEKVWTRFPDLPNG